MKLHGPDDSFTVQDMAPTFSFMFIALGKTSEAEARDILEGASFGTIDNIHVADMPDGRRKFFVHYREFTAHELRDRLVDFEKRKSEGEVDVRPVHLVYGEKSDGRPVYWQLYKTLTPTERAAASKKPFKPRVE